MVVEQIVEIPADRRVFFEFLAPKEIPQGPARVRVEFEEKPISNKPVFEKPLPKNWRELPTPRADALSGILSHISGVTLEEIREERFAKYLNLK